MKPDLSLRSESVKEHMEELRELLKLHDEGVITPEDFVRRSKEAREFLQLAVELAESTTYIESLRTKLISSLPWIVYLLVISIIVPILIVLMIK
jgi:hypothetical protein